MTVGGRERWALVSGPKAGETALPLVVLLHGGGGEPYGAQAAYGMTELAARENFLVVYPAGTGPFARRLLTWNAGNCCAHAMKEGVDDVAFLEALIGKLVKDGRADPGRVYLAGMSNGAMMSHRFACERADLVAAVGAVAGTAALRDCRPSRGVPVIMIHGLKDEHVPFVGGTGRKAYEPRVDRSFEATAALWERAGGVVERHVHAGGHIWPGGKPGRRPGGDVVLSKPDATRLLWEFFKTRRGG